MGRFAPAAAAALRLRLLLVGSGRNPRSIGHGKHSGGCQSPATPGLSGKQGLSFQMHGKISHHREYYNGTVFQLEPAHAALYSSSSQSTVQRGKKSTKDVPESLSGRRRKGGKSAAETASEKLKTQERPIVFECVECKAMCVKKILKDPYDRGVVIVRCMDCRSVNLISDKLDLFQEPGSMKKFLSERGVDVRFGPESSYEITPENLAEVLESATA